MSKADEDHAANVWQKYGPRGTASGPARKQHPALPKPELYCQLHDTEWDRGERCEECATEAGPARPVVQAGGGASEIDALRAENARLRAACEAAQEYLCGPHNAIDRKLVATKIYEALESK